jgi:hypothetical protein
MEEWRPIEGYNNYLVSNFGRVMNSRGYVFKDNIDSNGYYRVNLVKDGKLKTMRIHRLVAKAYLPSTEPSLNFIDHIDRNRLNNRVENLRWSNNTLNCHNRNNQRNSTSRYNGVSWDGEQTNGEWKYKKGVSGITRGASPPKKRLPVPMTKKQENSMESLPV